METDPLPILESISWNVQFYPFSAGVAFILVCIVLLLTCSAMISASEVAYFSLSPSEINNLKEHQNRRNIHALKNLENPEQLLATILVANNFVNVGVVILSAFVTDHLIDFSNSPTLGFIFQIVVITFLLLLFGEVIPKVYATRYAFSVSRFMSLPLFYLGRLFRPINAMLIFSTSLVNRKIQKQKQNISVDELSQALELTSDHELKDDKEILEGIVTFGNKSVDEIMRSRVDVVALEIEDSFEKVLDIINESGFSRIPVYEETFDNIKGILYIKDLLPHIHKGNEFRWQNLIRPPFFIPEAKKIDDLLEEFQKNKVHMAIVVDEYGGTSGIVTLEDVLEEIVGDITDEFDEDERNFTKIGENKYLFDGKVLLHDFYRIIGVDDDIFEDIKGEADSLAGLILELKGEFPAKHDKIRCKNFIFSIEAVDNRRIKQIKVEIKPEENTP